MKTICSIHEQAYDVGEHCPYCEPEETQPDGLLAITGGITAGIWGIGWPQPAPTATQAGVLMYGYCNKPLVNVNAYCCLTPNHAGPCQNYQQWSQNINGTAAR